MTDERRLAGPAQVPAHEPLLDADGIERLREAMRASRYTSAGIADRIGPRATAALRRNDLRAALRGHHGPRPARDPDPAVRLRADRAAGGGRGCASGRGPRSRRAAPARRGGAALGGRPGAVRRGLVGGLRPHRRAAGTRPCTRRGRSVELWLADATQGGDIRRTVEWLDWFDAHKVEAVGFGLVTLRRSGHEDPVVRVEDLRQAVDQPLGDQVAAWFDRQDRCAGATCLVAGTGRLPACACTRRPRSGPTAGRWTGS